MVKPRTLAPLFAPLCAAVAVIALGAAGGVWSSPAAHAGARPAASGNGEYIIRCPMTGEVQKIDPIVGVKGVSEHTHMFFGHRNVLATSTADGLRKQGASSKVTSCQDLNDTAAYWAPESFLNGKVFLPGCTPLNNGTGNYHRSTNVNKTIYIRAYYLTTSGASTTRLPPGLIMVVGTPEATAPPTTIGDVYWDCGAGGTTAKTKYQTPESAWPYTCAPFKFPGQQGLTEIINFPSCWNGQSSFTTPNGTAKVPGYLDPALGISPPPQNDLAYPPAGGCAKLDTATATYKPVPHVSMRIHYIGLGLGTQTPGGPDTLSTDGKTIDPSSCQAALNVGACTSQSSPPSNVALQLSSDPSGAPGAWYTAHADYWQTWQQGLKLGDPGNANTGTLNSLTQYCLDASVTCGFMPNTRDTSAPTYPPPAPSR
jgi:hypothetical protein